MSSSGDKKYKKTIELNFRSATEKEEFNDKWTTFRTERPSLGTNLQIMYFFLSLASKHTSEDANAENTKGNFHYNSFISMSREQAKEERLFVSCETSIESLVKAVYKLGQLSHFSKNTITAKLDQFSHYVGTFTISNATDSFLWKSSPYIDGLSSFFVNERMSFGVLCSGVMFEQFNRFVIAAKLGFTYRNFLYNAMSRIAPCLASEANESKNSAIRESLARNVESGITIETNACYSAFRNDTRSITLGICNDTHKVLSEKVKSTNTSDSSIQLHETLSIREILDDFKDKDVNVRCIVHDSNNSVSKTLNNDFPHIKEQKDVWHTIKNAMSGFSNIHKGPKKLENISWSSQLFDKFDGVKNHFWYSIMHSGNDADILRDSLDAIVLHYQGNHENCRLTSPCVRNPKYFPSRVLLTDPCAIKLLSDFIHNTPIYKNPDAVLEGLTTSYVEAANNSLRSFLPKRQSFGDVAFQARVNLFILHWNENVGPFVKSELEGSAREDFGPKYHCKKTYLYCDKIWQRYLAEFKIE